MARIFTRFSLNLLALAGCMAATCAVAHDARIGAIHVMHPAAPATLPGQSSGVVHLSIENEGSMPDKLLSATSPAGSVSLHSMTMNGNIMKMRELQSLALPAGAKVSLDAGSAYHLMLTGLQRPMKTGDAIPLTLTFEKAGKLEVSIHVEPNAAQKAGSHAGAHQH